MSGQTGLDPTARRWTHRLIRPSRRAFRLRNLGIRSRFQHQEPTCPPQESSKYNHRIFRAGPNDLSEAQILADPSNGRKRTLKCCLLSSALRKKNDSRMKPLYHGITNVAASVTRHRLLARDFGDPLHPARFSSPDVSGIAGRGKAYSAADVR
jgi:hypothetical protein